MNNDFKIVFAKQEMVDDYAPEVEKILEILGHPEAFITDESTLGDFKMFEISYHIKILNRWVFFQEKIWELAKELREMNNE